MNHVFWGGLFAVWASATGLSLVGTVIAWIHLSGLRRQDRKQIRTAPFSPVSILKPLRGLDVGLEENLRSFFDLDYPEYEIIFSIADAADPAADLVRELIAEYPSVQARLISGAVQVGPNPKVNNLVKSYAEAKYDWLLISDSNIRVCPKYLLRMTASFTEDVGVVTALISGRKPERIGGLLEATFLNTFYAKALIFTASLGIPCVLGKSMLFRRTVMDKIGGIEGLRTYLAEDFMAGKKIMAMGMRVVVLKDPVHQHIGDYSFATFWLRHLRWGRIRKMQNPPAFLLELCTGAVFSGLCGAFAFRYYFGFPVLYFLTLHLLLWLTEDSFVMSLMGQRPSLKSLGAWFVRELSYFPLWIHIASGNTVLWREQKIKLRLGGSICQRHQSALSNAGNTFTKLGRNTKSPSSPAQIDSNI